MVIRALLVALTLLLGGCVHLDDGVRPPPDESPTPIEATPSPADEPPRADPARTDGPTAGVVAAAHPIAADAGAEMLRLGGNAFDAAVATALVLGVVNPHSSGLGGGGFAVFRTAGGETASLDFREMAPSFFGPDTFADPGRDPARGPWSTGIPGEPAGLADLHALGGRLDWRTAVEPARAAAADGFAVGPDLAAAIQRYGDRILADPGLRADLAPEGRLLAEGETCRRPALAQTLTYLQLHGGHAFYEGPLAVAVSGFLARQGLPWSEAELAGYEVRRREVLTGTYRGLTVHTMPPPSSGGLVVLQSLALLESADHQSMIWGTPAWTRTLLQVLTHAFADRAAYGGDPDFIDLPVAELLDPELPAALLAITPEQGPVQTWRAGLAGLRGETKARVGDDGGTSHLSVLDAEGNAVALTTTVNLHFGSLQADPITGVVLNDEMDDFAARPGQANAFGLTQGTANAPEAGKRPLSSMTPTLVVAPDGQVLLAVGAAGGPRIITATLQVLLGVVDRQLDAEGAVAAPRLHAQWQPEEVRVEPTFDPAILEILAGEGFVFRAAPHLGTVQAASFDPATGSFAGAADPRAGGAWRLVEAEAPAAP